MTGTVILKMSQTTSWILSLTERRLETTNTEEGQEHLLRHAFWRHDERQIQKMPGTNRIGIRWAHK